MNSAEHRRRFEDIERKVLEIIKPKPHEYEKIRKAFEIIKTNIEEVLEKHGIHAKVSLEGSIAHDTWLSGDHDLDVFVLFPADWSVEELKTKGFKILLEAAEKIGEYETRYAEHPYVRVKLGDVEADLVPGFDVEESKKIRTAVDRTHLHTRYLLGKLDDFLRDQVRLLKKFMKNIGVYGAEIKTKGFSGYATELLIIKYGSFLDLLRNASRWKHPVYINTLETEELFKKVLPILKKKYPDSVIYMPDPVDPYRNVTASVSLKNLALFVVASKCYTRKPDLSFYFETEDTQLTTLEKSLQNRCIIIVKFNIGEDLPPETIWGEILRIGDRGAKLLKIHEFYTYYWDVWTDERKEAYILYEIDSCKKDTPKLYIGPKYWGHERIISFISKHINKNHIGPWIDQEGTLSALGERKYTDPICILIHRRNEYIVTPHFKDRRPLIRRLTRETLYELCNENKEQLCKWLAKSVLRRNKWMEKCIT